MNLFSTHSKREDGFTLLELLLVIGVTSFAFIGIAMMTKSWLDTEIATGGGQQLYRISHVVENHIKARWGVLTPTDDVLASAATNPDWEELRRALEQEGLLDGAGTLRSPLGVPLQIGYVIDNSSGTPIRRATIFSPQTILSKRALEAARQSGSTGGTISRLTAAGPTRAVGAFGQYNVGVDQLVVNSAVNPLTCVPTNTQSCLVSIVAYSESVLRGSYLYRNDMGDTSLNTMSTDLYMNGNDVLGAGNVDTRDLNVANIANLGTTNVSGPTTLSGPARMSNGVTIAGAGSSLTVDGNATFSNSVSMANGTLNADTINVNTVQAPTLSTNNFNAANLTMNNGDLTVDSNMNVQGTVTATGQVLATEINAGQINAANGAMNVGTMNIQNNMLITGDVTITDDTVVADRLVSDDCVRIADAAEPTGYKDYGICP